MYKIKNFLIFIFLISIFQSFTHADEISEFEIEGMVVGDSLLKYFNITDINKFIKHKSTYNYIDSDYTIIGVTKFNQNSLNLTTYSDLGITINKKDKQYKIFSIAGQNYTYANISECNKKQKQIADEIKDNLLDKKINEDIWENNEWTSGGVVVGKSIVHDFFFDDDSAIRVICYEVNEDGKKIANWDVKLDVIINSSKFNKFLMKN